jgi:hypothetical protein
VPPENRDMDDEDLPVATLVGPPRAAWYVRAVLLAIGVTLAGVFGVAVYLDPYNPDGSPRTMATHTRLGMPPCNFVAVTDGKPCPSCGMTTSFALLVRGDVRASLRANWVGSLLAVTWAGLLVWSVASAVAARPLFVPDGRGELLVTAVVGVFLALMIARWVVVLLQG